MTVAVARGLASPGRPLPPATRTFFEQRLPYDFSQVRLHTDATAARSAAAIAATAYTVGPDIVTGPAWTQMSPTGRTGVLAHELVHVVQQGACRPTDRSLAAREPLASVGTGVQRLDDPDPIKLPLFCGTYEDWLRTVLLIEQGVFSDAVTCLCLGAWTADVLPVIGMSPAVEAADCMCNLLTVLQLAFKLASHGGCLDWSKLTEDDAKRIGHYLGANVADCAVTLRILAGALAVALVGTGGGAASGGPAGAVGGGIGGVTAGAIAGDMLVDGIATVVQNLALQGQFLPEEQLQACERTRQEFLKNLPKSPAEVLGGGR